MQNQDIRVLMLLHNLGVGGAELTAFHLARELVGLAAGRSSAPGGVVGRSKPASARPASRWSSRRAIGAAGAAWQFPASWAESSLGTGST
jgi:hypothetical protein